ncbi:CorA family divalent cation transporter [Pseudidiomarina sediminum]|uniref:CorA family divalent cation transporter n=1 Tax=Pseudidiomarina sediminum TaxID=431675 RepID=UPI001C9759C2|nr:CorA family divalent cation transporter [Pseudidiomarina sediminum]MBY6063553.1 zinc transporter ZntB [Pseudidiomarina sediminum]
MTQPRPEFVIDSWDLSTHPAQPLSADLQHAEHRWFHIQRNLPGIEQWLASNGIPAPLIDAVLEEDTRPRFERNADGFLLILRGVNLTEGERPEDMLSLRILYYKGAIYSFRKRPVKSVGVIRERLNQQQGPESLHDLLINLIEEMNNRLEELLDVIEAEMEQLEDDEVAATTAERQRQLTQLHRRMLRLVRFVRPQLTAIERLAADAAKWLEPENVQWLINERDAVQRELESLEMLLEQVWMLREHLQQEVAEKMNRNTYWLSVIAGVFLPISFLTGVFGINIGGMPGVESEGAFWVFCIALGAIAVVEFLLLRRLRFW